MGFLSRFFCTLLYMGVSLFILAYSYREHSRLTLKSSLFISLFCSFLYTIPFAFSSLRSGHWVIVRIIGSCVLIFILGSIISRLLHLQISAVFFLLYVLRNLTDSVLMLSRLICIFLLPDTIFGDYTANMLFLALLLVLGPLFIYFANNCLKPSLIYAPSKIWSYSWTIPFMTYIFFRLITEHFYLKILASQTYHFIFFPIVWFISTLLGHSVVLKLMRDISFMASLKEQLKYSELIAELQKKEYITLQNNIDETRKIRHDMKHHLIILDGLLENNDVKSAKNYICSLIKSIDISQLKLYCQNHAVNSLLNFYVEQAKENQIHFSISVHLKESLSLPEVDFCAILGNLLENALEACIRQNEADAFISLSIDYAGHDMILIFIRNSFSGEIRTENGRFLSSKRNETGTGALSIQYMVEKYNGTCRFDYQNGIFEVSILLNPRISPSAS